MLHRSVRMTVKIEVTVDELEVIMDALEMEYNTWKECLGGADEDPYDRLEYEKTRAVMIRLDEQLLKLKEGLTQ
jgi:hypothetical protein